MGAHILTTNGASVVFPQSFLVDIIRNVRYGILVERGNFPQEWLSQRKTLRQEQGQTDARPQGSGNAGRGNDRQQSRHMGQGHDQYEGHQYGGPQYGGQGPYQGTGAQGGGYGGGYPPPNNYQPWDWRANWHDERHPKIKTMMAAYLERTHGRVHLAELLTASGKKQTDLPTLPQFVHPNGRPFICWSCVLGRCTFRECRFLQQGGHPAAKDITDDFANKVVDTLNKGVISLCGTATPVGSPHKKTKTTGEEQPPL